MAFHDTKKNNDYHSLFIKLFLTCLGGRFFLVTVYSNVCSLSWSVSVVVFVSNSKWTPEEDTFLKEVVNNYRMGDIIPWSYGKILFD